MKAPVAENALRNNTGNFKHMHQRAQKGAISQKYLIIGSSKFYIKGEKGVLKDFEPNC